jgi:hypothetical protein
MSHVAVTRPAAEISLPGNNARDSAQRMAAMMLLNFKFTGTGWKEVRVLNPVT